MIQVTFQFHGQAAIQVADFIDQTHYDRWYLIYHTRLNYCRVSVNRAVH